MPGRESHVQDADVLLERGGSCGRRREETRSFGQQTERRPAAFRASAFRPDDEVVDCVRAGDIALHGIVMRRHDRRMNRAVRSTLRPFGLTTTAKPARKRSGSIRAILRHAPTGCVSQAGERTAE
ncbi:MAG TPA: hypothetical protein ENI85_03320 [Deltaproteobacteria bacterium]|nr:hypothetical protein [Deltaproteobacteria bacterium]